jgi:hypothetical protein
MSSDDVAAETNEIIRLLAALDCDRPLIWDGPGAAPPDGAKRRGVKNDDIRAVATVENLLPGCNRSHIKLAEDAV